MFCLVIIISSSLVAEVKPGGKCSDLQASTGSFLSQTLNCFRFLCEIALRPLKATFLVFFL